MNGESVARTMLIAIGVALFCSAFVSGAVFYLRPLQASYAALERNRVILEVADRLPANDDDRTVVGAFNALEARIYDLVEGRAVDRLAIDAHAYDHWTSTLAEAAPAQDASAIGLDSVPRYVPFYLTRREGEVERVVLPLHGQGMWSTIRGYLALGDGLNTVAAIRFHDHGETPGIGDRIQKPEWLATWQGKQVQDAAGKSMIAVTKDRGVPVQHRVDAITGATVTSEATGRIVGYWAGPNGYGPLLAALRAGEDVQ